MILGKLASGETLMRKYRILHVSADFPDCVQAAKTPVIRTLLELVADQFDQEVWSLNRYSPPPLSFLVNAVGRGLQPRLGIEQQAFEFGTAVRYAAPPRGLFHATMLRQLGDQLARSLEGKPLPDIIIGHKLSVEGLVVRRAARKLGIPYGLSIQGNTDAKILSARADLKGEFARTFHEAAVVFPFSPWALRRVEERLGKRSGPVHMLPCATEIDTPLSPNMAGEGLVSVFHLRGQHTKNLSGMAQAMRLLERGKEAPGLAILGGGSEAELARCQSIARITSKIEFEGPISREALPERLNRAAGFVLPSRRESFGLVFIEALFCGLPVIYPAGAAVDGYFDDAEFALRVDASDPAAIADAMRKLVRDQKQMKRALALWQQSEDAVRFSRAAIAQVFNKGLRYAVESSRLVPPQKSGTA